MSASIPPKFSALGEAALTLEPTNFTPLSRTPWAGTRISTHYKSLEKQQIGESWEVSVEPQFPSHARADRRTLERWLAIDPAFFLGAETEDHIGCALLVKLLDTADRLSLQIHPTGSEAFLSDDESGKPESWLVLEAEPGCGIYLGLADGVDEQQMRAALASGCEAVEAVLHFEPVQRGDFFRIDAGTPHAIGKGLTLVEPQRVEPRKRGLTYRYYDWDRRYDLSGAPDPKGNPRPLHLEEAIRVTNWDAPRGREFVEQVRTRTTIEPESAARIDRLLGPDAALLSELIEVASCAGCGSLPLGWDKRLCGVTAVAGRCTLVNRAGKTHLSAGQSAVIPAALAPETRIEAELFHGLLCAAP